MLRSVASILGLHCLLRPVCPNTYGKHGNLVKSNTPENSTFLSNNPDSAPDNTCTNIQSTPVISNSKGLTETLRDIRTSTYQSWESEENNKLNNHI